MVHIKFSVLFALSLLTVLACLPSTKKVRVVTAPAVNKKVAAKTVSTNYYRIGGTLGSNHFLSEIAIPTSEAADSECDTANTVCAQIWNAVAAVCALETGDLRSCYNKYLADRAQCVSDATDGRCALILH